MKSKQEMRAESAAVAHDMSEENPVNWLREGAWVSIQCADPIYHGRIAAITPSHYFLDNASWVVDTGRTHQFAVDPQSRLESEYIGEIAVERPVVAVTRLRVGGALETK